MIGPLLDLIELEQFWQRRHLNTEAGAPEVGEKKQPALPPLRMQPWWVSQPLSMDVKIAGYAHPNDLSTEQTALESLISTCWASNLHLK